LELVVNVHQDKVTKILPKNVCHVTKNVLNVLPNIIVPNVKKALSELNLQPVNVKPDIMMLVKPNVKNVLVNAILVKL